MIEFVAHNLAPIMFASLIAFLLASFIKAAGGRLAAALKTTI